MDGCSRFGHMWKEAGEAMEARKAGGIWHSVVFVVLCLLCGCATGTRTGFFSILVGGGLLRSITCVSKCDGCL